MRVLVVEDEKDLNDIMTKRLKQEGYTVDACYDGMDAWDYIMLSDYDVILLDIMIPRMSGLELLEKLRKERMTTKVILITAKDEVEERVYGLDCGADDYMVKPFSFEELLARIRAITRRSAKMATNIYQIANLTVDFKKREVLRDQTMIIPLSAKEFALLEYLIQNQGIVLSRDKIERKLWSFDYEGGSNIIDVYIRYLRKKIDDGYEPKLIHTVRGVGYVLRDETE